MDTPTSQRTSRSTTGSLALVALAAIAWTCYCSCGSGSDHEVQAIATTDQILARERVAYFFEAGYGGKKAGAWRGARKALEPLLAAKPPELQDLLRAAAVELNAQQFEAARGYLAQVAARDGDNAALHYMLGRMLYQEGEADKALPEFEAVRKVAPHDLANLLSMSMCLDDLDQYEAQEAILKQIIEVGVEHGGSWYITAIYRMKSLLNRLGETERARPFEQLWARYDAQDFKPTNGKMLDRGNLGDAPAPPAQGTEVAANITVPVFEVEAPILPELAGATLLDLRDANGDRAPDILAAGAFGLKLASLRIGVDSRHFEVSQLVTDEVSLMAPFDLGNDDDMDLLLWSGGQLWILENEASKDEETGKSTDHWQACAAQLPQPTAAPKDVCLLDMDHDGDLDILIVGAGGALLLRCDGNIPKDEQLFVGAFTDVTIEAGLPKTGNYDWCMFEDFDADGDVDMLFGGSGPTFLADNLRGGHFEQKAQVFGANSAMPRKPLVADFDGDARADFFVPGAPSHYLMRQADGSYGKVACEVTVPPNSGPLMGEDIDLNGALDILWRGPQGLVTGIFNAGLESAMAATIAGPALAVPTLVVDMDHKEYPIAHEIVRVTDKGIEVARCKSELPRGVVMQWFGKKDNREAVGALVELRFGHIYRRVFWRGGALLIGAGQDAEWIDTVRITWPNGVTQFMPPDQELGVMISLDPSELGLEQPEGLLGSCPFLYTWNGATYEFISDVLGITPLGLPMAPGVLVPPDHDEYVLVRGSQLAPKDGFLEMQFTEELREVTYLDRVRLEVVDHPIGTEVFPDERFTFPPFPEPHTHSMRDPLAPTRALDQEGRDWTQALAATDDVHAVPFEVQEAQFLGLATPHWLELSFDKAAVKDAAKLRLLFTGWFYWTDASVNMAAARVAGVDFIPPILQVPDGQGGWRDAGPPVGFPAGKTKSMVIDVSEILQREDPRLRVFSTLRLYWDRIALAIDNDDAELRTKSLEPVSAELWVRGFSAALAIEKPSLPQRFDWDLVAFMPRWNQHPGRYTKLGECLPLLTAIDDRYIVMGSGDALTLRFDANDLPPLAEGFERDYLVFLDGWAKDRDPNTVEALEVEPLPFHGMSGYPYGADEHFPDDAVHQQWRAEWQTRESFQWIAPLSPKREVEWALGQF